MKSKFKLVTQVLLSTITILLLAGCVSTSLTSYRDPEFSSRTFYKPIVFAATADIQWRDALETEIVHQFDRKNIVATKSIDVAPPTRGDIDWVSLIPQLKASGHDSVVFVKISDLTLTESYVPKTYGTTRHSGTISTYGNTATYSGTSYTPSYGGYSVNKPSASIETTVFELDTLKKVWVSGASSNGGGASTFSDIRRSYATKLVKKLKEDGVLNNQQ